MKSDLEFSFKVGEEQVKIFKHLVSQLGIRHYVLKTKDNEELDVVDYSEYQKLEKENEELNQKYLNAVSDYEQEKFKVEELKDQLRSASLQIQEMVERDIECPSNCSKLKNKQDIIDKLKSKIEDDIDGFSTLNEYGGFNDIIVLLYIYLDMLEDKWVE